MPRHRTSLPTRRSSDLPTVIVAAITGRINKAKIPTHVEIEKSKYKLDKDSVILLEQIRTLDKNRLKEKLTYLSEEKMKEVNNNIDNNLGLINIRNNRK